MVGLGEDMLHLADGAGGHQAGHAFLVLPAAADAPHEQHDDGHRRHMDDAVAVGKGADLREEGFHQLTVVQLKQPAELLAQGNDGMDQHEHHQPADGRQQHVKVDVGGEKLTCLAAVGLADE